MKKIKITTNKYDRDVDFVKKAFTSVGKTDSYYHMHPFKTLKCIRSYGLRHKEIPTRIIDELSLASLGHDLLEDTKVTSEEIEKMWGSNVLSYINSMTNKKGDSDFSDYIMHLKNGSEEVMLIKLSDIHSNVFNSIKNLKTLDKKWVKTFWIPLLDTYNKELFVYKFKKYSKTAFAIIRSIRKQIIVLKKIV